MKRLIKLLAVLSVIALPQLLSAYTHKVINEWNKPVTVRIDLFGTIFSVYSQEPVIFHVEPGVTHDEGVYGFCTLKISASDKSTGRSLGSRSFGGYTCTGSTFTIRKDGTVHLKKNLG